MKRKTLSVLVAAVSFNIATAHAITVFDPSNYAQNMLQAARALEQINNQIQSLQNQAVMLQNMARHLQRLDYSSLGQITGALQRIDGLMNQAQGIGFDLAQTDVAWQEHFPESYDAALSNDEIVIAARARWSEAMNAYRQTLRMQAAVVENTQADTGLLAELVAQSQGTIGSLQAQQATNQLLALSTKQQLQIQNLMASQYRAQALDDARRAQSEEVSRVATRRFIGTSNAYTPQ
jgi:P-type conjugative transfer protein TrbJ